MSGTTKAITLRATYESDLSGLHKDMAAIKSIRKRLEKDPIRIPLALDLSGIKSQAAKAAQEYGKALKAEMAAIKPGEGMVSKGGILIPPGARRELESFAAATGKVFKTVTSESAKGIKSITEFEQVARGLERRSQRTATGKSKGSQIIDTRPIENMKAALQRIESDFAGKMGAVKGSKGDVAAMMEEKRSRISKELAKFGDLENTAEYRRAAAGLDKLKDRIAETQGKQDGAANKAAKDGRNKSLGSAIDRIDSGFANVIGNTKGTKGDMAAVLESKRNQIANELTKFADIADSPAFQKAQKAITNLNRQIAELQPKQAAAADKAARDGRTKSLGASINRIDSGFANVIGNTKGTKGDMAAVLASKRDQIANELTKFADIADSPAFQKAQKAMTTLNQQIAELQPKQAAAADKAKAAGRNKDLGSAIDRIDSRYAGVMGSTKGTKGDMAAVLESKRNRIAKELAKFSDIADSPAFSKAQKAITTLNKQIAEARPKQAAASQKNSNEESSQRATNLINRVDRATQKRMLSSKAEMDIANHIRDEGVRLSEQNRILEKRLDILKRTQEIFNKRAEMARMKGNDDAARKYTTASRRIGNDYGNVMLDGLRQNNATNTAAEDRALTQKLNETMRLHKAESERLRTQEAMAKKTNDLAAREAELNRILREREKLNQNTGKKLEDVHRKASVAGKHFIADRATNAAAGLNDQMEAAYRRMGTAAKASGHDIDFHSNSLLRNAATFTKWFIPAQLVMGTFSAIGAGASSAVAAERTFKTLNAVFQGTREESELLAKQTLQLAAANGRNAEEAAQAAVSWARLGLTRSQILMVMETSLRAANVAEISTADATKYLTAQYKAFNQTLTDIPANLDYINSLSNRYNVTPENIFQGIARTATVAKQAGVELRELASIIAIVSDVTGRPGEETGNAMKFILTRIRRPQTLDAIKDEFDLDLRKPNGDAKAMTEIFGDLAALYPKLNRLEKARINDLVAGSRQTERYAVIVDNWTEILIAQANAAADANSAQRENAEILSSVDASLQQVSTSWTAFITSLGELGVFDAAAGALKDLAGGLNAVNNAMTPPKRGKDGKMTDPGGDFLNRYGDLFEKDNNGKTPLQRGTTISPLVAAAKLARRAMMIKAMAEASPEDKQAIVAAIRTKLGTGSSTASDTTTLALETQQGFGKAESMDASSAAFAKMAQDVKKPSVERNKMLKQFDMIVGRLGDLPGGLKNVADARLNVRPLLESGDRNAAAEALQGFSGSMAAGRDKQIAATEEGRIRNYEIASKKVEGLRQELTDLNRLMSEGGSTEAQQRYQDSIANTTDRLRDAEEAAKALAKTMSERQVDAISADQSARIDEYVKDLAMIQEMLGGTITGFGNTGFADVDAKLRIGGALLARDSMDATLESTRRSNAAFAEANQPSINAYNEFGTEGMDADTADKYTRKIEAIREELRLRGDIEAKIGEEARKLAEATEYAERKLEIQRQADMLQQSHSDGAAGMRSRLGGYAIGATEGERITNQVRASLASARGIITNPATGAGNALSDARELGQLSEALSQSKQGVLSMEQRMYQATADRANLEIEITENLRTQREEAAKRLALASREDQFRAAAASAVLRNRGQDGFSMQEFQFFSQDTRGAISNFMPEKVKGLDDTERENNRSRLKLEREIDGLASSLQMLREEAARTAREAAETAGRLGRGMVPTAPDGNTIANPDGNKGETRLNLNLGDVAINLDFAPHVNKIADMLKGHLDQRFTQEMAAIRRMFRTPGTPDNSPAVGAF